MKNQTLLQYWWVMFSLGKLYFYWGSHFGFCLYSPTLCFANCGLQPNIWWVLGWAHPPSLVSGWLQFGILWMQLEATLQAFRSSWKVTSYLLWALESEFLLLPEAFGGAREGDGSWCSPPPSNRWVMAGGSLKTPALFLIGLCLPAIHRNGLSLIGGVQAEAGRPSVRNAVLIACTGQDVAQDAFQLLIFYDFTRKEMHSQMPL